MERPPAAVQQGPRPGTISDALPSNLPGIGEQAIARIFVLAVIALAVYLISPESRQAQQPPPHSKRRRHRLSPAPRDSETRRERQVREHLDSWGVDASEFSPAEAEDLSESLQGGFPRIFKPLRELCPALIE